MTCHKLDYCGMPNPKVRRNKNFVCNLSAIDGYDYVVVPLTF